jgi:hypothetical protein
MRRIGRFFIWMGWPILALPIVMFLFGLVMNEVTVYKNGLQMPYMHHECAQFDAAHYDDSHFCDRPGEKLRFWSDWIVTSEGSASPGDSLQAFAGSIGPYCVYIWIALLLAGKFECSA